MDYYKDEVFLRWGFLTPLPKKNEVTTSNDLSTLQNLSMECIHAVANNFREAFTYGVADGYPQALAFICYQCADFFVVVDTTTLGHPIWQDRFDKGTVNNVAYIVWHSRHWKGVWGKLEGIRRAQFHRLCSCTN